MGGEGAAAVWRSGDPVHRGSGRCVAHLVLESGVVLFSHHRLHPHMQPSSAPGRQTCSFRQTVATARGDGRSALSGQSWRSQKQGCTAPVSPTRGSRTCGARARAISRPQEVTQSIVTARRRRCGHMPSTAPSADLAGGTTRCSGRRRPLTCRSNRSSTGACCLAGGAAPCATAPFDHSSGAASRTRNRRLFLTRPLTLLIRRLHQLHLTDCNVRSRRGCTEPESKISPSLTVVSNA